MNPKYIDICYFKKYIVTFTVFLIRLLVTILPK